MRIMMVYGGVAEYRTGVLTVIENLSESLEANGHEIFQLMFTKLKNGAMINPLARRYMVYTNGNQLQNHYILMRTLKGLISELNIDIVHYHGALLSCLLLGNHPFIVTNHGVFSEIYRFIHERSFLGGMKSGLYKKIGGLLYSRSPVVTAVSSYTMNQLVNAYRIDKLRVRVVPNGVSRCWYDADGFTQDGVRLKLGFDMVDPVLLFLRPAERIKGLDLLLYALPALVNQFPSLRLLIAGERGSGDYRDEIDNIIYREKLADHVTFLGQISYRDLPMYYTASDLCIVPSREEAFSMVTLESLARERPVVAYGVGGIPEIVSHGVDGILIKAGDIAGLAKGIIDLLSSRNTISTMGLKGKNKIINGYTWERISSIYLDIYTDVINHRDH